MKRQNARGFGVQKNLQPAVIGLLNPVRVWKPLNFIVFSESVQPNRKQYLKNIGHLGFILESCVIKMMHPSTSQHRNLFHTLPPLKYVFLCVCVYQTHTHVAGSRRHMHYLHRCMLHRMESILSKFSKRSYFKLFLY